MKSQDSSEDNTGESSNKSNECLKQIDLVKSIEVQGSKQDQECKVSQKQKELQSKSNPDLLPEYEKAFGTIDFSNQKLQFISQKKNLNDNNNQEQQKIKEDLPDKKSIKTDNILNENNQIENSQVQELIHKEEEHKQVYQNLSKNNSDQFENETNEKGGNAKQYICILYNQNLDNDKKVRKDNKKYSELERQEEFSLQHLNVNFKQSQSKSGLTIRPLSIKEEREVTEILNQRKREQMQNNFNEIREDQNEFSESISEKQDKSIQNSETTQKITNQVHQNQSSDSQSEIQIYKIVKTNKSQKHKKVQVGNTVKVQINSEVEPKVQVQSLVIEPLYKGNQKIGGMKKEYEIIDQESVYSHQVIYKIQKSQNQVIREIKIVDFPNFTNTLYSLIQYQLAVQNFKGNDRIGLGNKIREVQVQKERFIKVYDFWGENSSDVFYLFSVQENVPLFINQIKKLFQVEQFETKKLALFPFYQAEKLSLVYCFQPKQLSLVPNFQDEQCSLIHPFEDEQRSLIPRFTPEQLKKIQEWVEFIIRTFVYIFRKDQKFLFYIDSNVQNLCFRNQSQYASYNYTYRNYQRGEIKAKDIPIFTFRSEQALEIGIEEELQSKKIITIDNILSQILTSLLQYLNKIKVDQTMIDQLQTQLFEFIKRQKDYVNDDIFSNFGNYLQDYIKNNQIDNFNNNNRKEQLMYFKDQFIDKNLLGEGAFGKVYKVQNKKGQCFAIKIQDNFSCIWFSHLFYETSFHLVFKDEKNLLPLIALEDLFVSQDKNKKGYIFTLYILMELADTDLNKILKLNKNTPMKFLDFLPVIKDTILGIVYMHSNARAHRDIKPDNILKMESGKIVLVDYGIGINLEGEESYNENNYLYQIGEWKLAGTQSYLDPILRNFLGLCLDDPNLKKKPVKINIFKADIYSLGITLYQIVTGKYIININNNEWKQKVVYNNIHSCKIPLQIKQLILHMVQFIAENRIPSYALYLNLKEIITKLSLAFSFDLKNIYPLIQTNPRSDWFDQMYSKLGTNIKYQNLKKQTETDQSFYAGTLKLDFVDSEENGNAKFNQNQMVVIKPNFMPGIVQKHLENDIYSVNVIGNIISVNASNILQIKLPFYKKNQQVEFYYEKINKWTNCKIQDVNNNLYAIIFTNQEQKCVQEVMPINTLRLRPAKNQHCIFDEFEYHEIQILEKEMLLLKDPNFIHYNQLFAMDLNLDKFTTENINTKFEEFNRMHFLNPRLNIYGGNNQTKFGNLLNKDNVSIISKLSLDGCDLDQLLESEVIFNSLNYLQLWSCQLSHFDDLINKISTQTTSLTILDLWNLKIKKETQAALNDNFMELLSNNPLKYFELIFEPEDISRVKITFNNVIEIFKSLSSKRLRFFQLILEPTLEKVVSKNDLDLLQKHFTLFLKNSSLYCFDLRVKVKNNNNKKNQFLKSFSYIEDYIKVNKEQVEKMEYFRVVIGNSSGDFNDAYLDEMVKKVQQALGNNSKWTCKDNRGGKKQFFIKRNR